MTQVKHALNAQPALLPAPAEEEVVTATPPLDCAAPVPQLKRQRVVLELHLDPQRCLSCGGCVSVCPRMAVPVSHINSLADGILCRGCGICVQVCPVEALSQAPIVLDEPLRVPGNRDRRRAAPITPPELDEAN
jgi:ferredoxin